ncbi:hypothetical protein KDX23_07640 [Burkholderia vietnamiensis]|uniref:hypothetical protein n=1 Tax=Burkholderia vietnamiensis TaxID=60552 RepID=UPI001B911E31|nr:hypothetical protein [Burkholderia vietnamiensis]MBR8082617.1 hypothetical protein [Burkholderia vietnamiensis]
MPDDLDPLTDDAFDGMNRLVDSLRHSGSEFAPVAVVVETVAGKVREMVNTFGQDGTAERLLALDDTLERADVDPIVTTALLAEPSLPPTLVETADALGPSPVPEEARTALYGTVTSSETIEWVTDDYWMPSHVDYAAAKEATSAVDAFSYAIRAFTIEQRAAVTGKLLGHLLAGKPIDEFDLKAAAAPPGREISLDACLDLPAGADGTLRLGVFYATADASERRMTEISFLLFREGDRIFADANTKGATVALHLVLMPMVVPPASTEKRDDVVFSGLLRETAIVQTAVVILWMNDFRLLDAIEAGAVEVVVVPFGHDQVYRLGRGWLNEAKNAFNAVRAAFGETLPDAKTDRGREVLRSMLRFIEASDRCYPERMGWRDDAELKPWIRAVSSHMVMHGGDHGFSANVLVRRPIATAMEDREEARQTFEARLAKQRP